MTIGSKMKYFFHLLLALTALATTQSAYATETSGHVIGEARDLKTDEFLYREIYCANGNPDEMEVIYRNDEGSLLARKLLDYSSGRTTPSFVQQNYYSNEVIEVDLKAGNVTMTVLDAVNSETKKASSTRTDGQVPVVIDAGFDDYVRSNWDSLLAGDRQSFLFPFAERDKLVKLRIKKSACTYPSETHQCFRLELSNWFIRMLVSPIELGYDPELQRLMRYRGLSNIGDGKGNGSVVDIRYDYQQIPERACIIGDQVLDDSLKPARAKS